MCTCFPLPPFPTFPCTPPSPIRAAKLFLLAGQAAWLIRQQAPVFFGPTGNNAADKDVFLGAFASVDFGAYGRLKRHPAYVDFVPMQLPGDEAAGLDVDATVQRLLTGDWRARNKQLGYEESREHLF